jgi:hypothetical protein
MGFYVETCGNHNKAEYLAKIYNGEIIQCPANFSEIPEGKALVVVVDNGMFEAAAFAHSEDEFKCFTQNPNDERPKKYVLLDRNTVEVLSGYKKAGMV